MEAQSYLEPKSEKIPSGSQISAIRFCNTGTLLLMGTGQKGTNTPGVLRAYRYPFTGEVGRIQLHSRSITHIEVSYDDSKIFTVGEDNVLTIIELDDTETRTSKEKNVISLPFNLHYLYDKD